MRLRPLRRSSAPGVLKEPTYVSPRHLMKSSSMPPAVVTIHDTWLCSTSQRRTPRRPDEMRLEVYPKKIVVLSPVSGSFHARYQLLAKVVCLSEFETLV